jgi:hypothetical protein
MTNKIKVEINDSTTSHNNNMSVELESDKDSVSSLVMKATELINEHKRDESKWQHKETLTYLG